MLLPNSLKLPWAEQPVTTYEDLLWQMVLYGAVVLPQSSYAV